MFTNTLRVVLGMLVGLGWCVPAALAADKPITAFKLFLRDGVYPAQRKLNLLTRDPAITFGSNGDSDNPVLNGASLLVFNPLTGEAQCIIMPAQNWEIGAAGVKYIYHDVHLALGPVKLAYIKAGKVKVVAKGSQLSITLNETSQGKMSAHYTSGTGSKLCAFFPTPRLDRPGIFLAS